MGKRTIAGVEPVGRTFAGMLSALFPEPHRAGRLRRGLAAGASSVVAIAAIALTGPPANVVAGGYGVGPGPVAVTPYAGFDPILARAPYVTDLTQTSASVSWATTTNALGTLTYGPIGSCTANTIAVTATMVSQVRVSPNPTTTYPTRYDYQASVPITGLDPSKTYCYEVFGSGANATDLLPASQPWQSFTTLDQAGAAAGPLTFVIVGDFGETANRGAANDPAANSPTSVNSNQAAIDSLIGSSGARFVISVGDIAYNDGGNYNYGDLQQTGASVGGSGLTEISDIFGPSYWPLTGGIPLYTAGGNHGQNSILLSTWPEAHTAGASGGAYALQGYPSIDGSTPAAYPNDWYAFSSGNTRFYLLDGSWTEANVGTALGSDCPYTAGTATCKAYQLDADAHFQPTSTEYQWLVNDLQNHPGGIKLAFFHYPLRSDNATQDSDVYLQRTLEPVLAQYGVQIAFSGHAHDYERNIAPGPNTLVTYVTGGGGGVISTVAGKGCSPWDSYAIGWTYSSGTGQKCGSAPRPTSDAQVYHFLKVTISGGTILVDPINAAGQIFDEQSYTVTMPVPTAPANVVATATSTTSVNVAWSPSTETGGTIAGYQVTRNNASLAAVAGSSPSYVDSTALPGTTYIYGVAAVDGAGVTSSTAASSPVTTPWLMTGFEAGTMAGWSPVVGQVAAESAVVHGGVYGAALTSAGGQTFALQNLAASSPVLYAQAWVNIASQSTTCTLFGLRTQATSGSGAYQVAQVYVNATGTVKVLNNVSKASYLGNATIAPGAWHQLTLAVNETAGTIQVWLDGVAVQFSTSAGWTGTLSSQSLGAVAMGNFQLGDDSTGRTCSWYADDVVVSSAALNS